MAAKPFTPASRITTLAALGGLGSGDLGAAAGIIRDEAVRLSARWSRQVPAHITVGVAGNVATITADAPPAYPNETGSRHPVYARGPRSEWEWTKGNYRPFLGPAADAKADAAMARYAKRIDKMARKAGFE
jgi:hypothetical protein